VIDLHSHVLFGVDDGPEGLEGSLAICAAAAADGITVLAATPHVRDDYPTTPELMEARLAEVQAAAGDQIRIVPGGEIDVAELARPLDELRRFALAGNPAYLLVETPYFGWPLDFPDRVYRLALAGIRAVIAHPERNADVQERPELLERLVAGGALAQLTAASVDGRLGPRSRKTSQLLLERGLAHLIASDAHEASIRAVGMSSAADAVGDEALARYLTVDVPRAIVEGGPLPDRPEPQKRRGLFRGRSRDGR
jgi:protein-tyrosine phosphatase